MDRGDFIERDLDRYVLGLLKHHADSAGPEASLRLRDVFVAKNEQRVPTVPYWVANATIFRSGAIFPFAPDILRQFNVVKYTHHMREFQLTNEYDLPLAVGLKTSASFPVVVPATTLEVQRNTPAGVGEQQQDYENKHRYLRLLDGGLADNLAVLTAVDLLCSDKASRKLLVVADAYKGDAAHWDSSRGSEWWLPTLQRILGISLDSWRGRYKEIVRALANQCGIEVVFLGFEELITDLFDKTPEPPKHESWSWVMRRPCAEQIYTTEDSYNYAKRLSDAAHNQGTNAEQVISRLLKIAV